MRGNRIILFGLGMSTMGLQETLQKIIQMVKNKKGGKIYCCTLNEIMMADEDKNFKKVLEKGDVLTTDGMPLVWLMRWRGINKERVYGPDLLRAFLERNKKEKIECIFVGDQKNEKYLSKFGKYLSVPFKKSFTKNALKTVIGEIKKIKVGVVWISLGSKKQIEVADKLADELPNMVFLTVGAAFDFLSGNKKQCPKLIRNLGGEWLFRWINEPKRLGRRYFKNVLYLSRHVVSLIRKKIIN